MLRAITFPLFGLDAKFLGVITMGGAIAILFVMPWLDRSPVKSMRYKGWLSRVWLAIFVVSFVILGYLGTLATTEGRTQWLSCVLLCTSVLHTHAVLHAYGSDKTCSRKGGIDHEKVILVKFNVDDADVCSSCAVQACSWTLSKWMQAIKPLCSVV